MSTSSLDHFVGEGDDACSSHDTDASKGGESDRRSRPLRTPRKRLPSWLKTEIPTGGR